MEKGTVERDGGYPHDQGYSCKLISAELVQEEQMKVLWVIFDMCHWL